MNELALFAGAGGGILGGKLLGWTTVCAVEIEDYPRRVLMARQDDGTLPAFPIWDDVRTFDGKPWRGVVDIVTGGFPCQDISAAGKGAGIDGERSGLWGEMARIIREVGPRFVLVENSPMLASRGFGRVVGDLAEMGYNARWGVLGAIHAGAPHKRERIWIRAELANTGRERREARRTRSREAQDGEILNLQTPDSSEALANSSGGRCGRAESGKMEQLRRTEALGSSNAADPARLLSGREIERAERESLSVGNAHGERKLQQEGCEPSERGRTCDTSWWLAEPAVGRVAHGVADRVDRLRALGNGQVPAVVRLAWRLLSPNTKGQP